MRPNANPSPPFFPYVSLSLLAVVACLAWWFASTAGLAPAAETPPPDTEDPIIAPLTYAEQTLYERISATPLVEFNNQALAEFFYCDIERTFNLVSSGRLPKKCS